MLPLLHAISYYSLLSGILSPENICAYACRIGYKTIAITDWNNVYGLPALQISAKQYGIKIIIAVELEYKSGNSVLIYADGDTGFANLCTLITDRNVDSSFDFLAALKKYHSGLIIVTDEEELVFKLMNHCQIYYRFSRPQRLPNWVKNTRIPALIVPPAVFMSKDDYSTHKLLRAIAGSTTIPRLSVTDLFPEDAFFVSPQQLYERFEMFEAAIVTTCQFATTISSSTSTDVLKMPEFPCDDPNGLLRRKTFLGAKVRYANIDRTVTERIDYELEIIISKGFAGYFLIVEDIVKQSPRICGRGSGAASIVAYSLGITNVDPIRYHLMFERFLNPDRSDPPDIDIDFPWDERDCILEYVLKKYGKDHVAMVATHQTCGIRMAIREVARVYGLTEREIGLVTRKVPYFIDIKNYVDNLETVVRQWPSLQNISLEPPWDVILKEAGKIIGFPRGIGTHCGGILITSCRITAVAPVQISAKGFPVIQWEKNGTEAMGLVKIDLLGNRSLAVIRDTIVSLKKYGKSFDEDRWDPQSDPATQKLLAEGRTMGVFYVESPAMRLLQRKSGKGDFDHLVIHSSIIRPAANKFIRIYLERLHGKSFQPYHPLIAETLSETFGIMVYQEDVAKVAMALAGFSAFEADKLRKVVTKKGWRESFNSYKNLFFNGASKKGVQQRIIIQIWEMILSFSGYSFCKPHSASYVQVSFQSAFLKAHFPAFFMAAVLSNYGGFYTTQAYISEAIRLGIRIVSPDVNKSTVAYGASATEIYVGLCQVRGLSRSAQYTIINEREKNGSYCSLIELLERTAINETDAEKLILSGACDALGDKIGRPEQFWMMRAWYRSGQKRNAPRLPGISSEQYLIYQYQILGYLTDCHPLSLIRSEKKRPVVRARHIDSFIGKTIEMYGWCITSKTVTTKTGDSMEFVTFEDETGTFETVFFPEIFKKYSPLLAWQMAFLISGQITEEFGVAILEVCSLTRI